MSDCQNHNPLTNTLQYGVYQSSAAWFRKTDDVDDCIAPVAWFICFFYVLALMFFLGSSWRSLFSFHSSWCRFRFSVSSFWAFGNCWFYSFFISLRQKKPSVSARIPLHTNAMDYDIGLLVSTFTLPRRYNKCSFLPWAACVVMRIQTLQSREPLTTWWPLSN